jgi:hypothetical protein
MRYYVGNEAEATADVLWQAAGLATTADRARKINKSGNKRPHGRRILKKE